MHHLQTYIKPYEEKYRRQVLSVWEKSVLATHDFLSPADFASIKAAVSTIDFNAFSVFCLVQEDDEVIGFLGVAGRKIEMLFLDPLYLGQGWGRKLMDFALTALNAREVDVNEQNVKAVKFYERIGFVVYDRTVKDDQGKPYPLLRMTLKNSD